MSAQLLSELARVKVAFQLRAIGAVLGIPASVDCHPQGGDGTAPFMTSAVGPVGAETPNTHSKPAA